MFLAGCSYAFARWNPWGFILATLCLALNWFGDSLDGTLARVRNCQRPRYGFYVDHMIDSVGALFLIGGLAISGQVDWRIAAGMLIAFLLLSIETYLASYTLGIFRSILRKIRSHGNSHSVGPSATSPCSFTRTQKSPGLPYRLLDFGGAIAIAAMGAMLLVATASHTITLYREETSIKMTRRL